ncbi:MAG: RNA 2',3'-cyclic phosphodiesterase [Candidatus Omnitrophica bacterium]|nr:RNA 2',3'-cyclic phosphodiesterase [Candidatus Omnitrophota bacterium]
MSELVRSFIAVEVGKAERRELLGLISTLKEAGADVKWVRPENLHLTLKFLGDVEEERLGEVKGFLDRAAYGTKAFGIHLAGVGAFPGIHRPTVIWAGVDKGEELLAGLAGKVEEGAAGIGFQKEERPFAGHLTLGRVRTRKNLSRLVSALERASFSSAVETKVDGVSLYKSTLTPEGSVYELIHRARLI